MSQTYSTAAAASLYLGNKPSVLQGGVVFNDGPAQYLHIYDLPSSTIATDPADTPVAILHLPENQAVSLEILKGLSFQNGILLANSTTSVAFAAGAADCWFTIIS